MKLLVPPNTSLLQLSKAELLRTFFGEVVIPGAVQAELPGG